MSSRLFARIKSIGIKSVPRDFHPPAWYAQRWGVTEDHARRLLAQATRAGLVEKRAFSIKTATRGRYPVPHYREIKT